MPTNNPLPPKEKNLFNRILKCYEHKQYKNGLKFAKQILSNPKFAEHGETLAMKGLTLNCLGRKEEGYELVKRGLKNDLKSHVCWHVYGLLQRSDKKYDEAIKCYRNALKWDSENMHILRDLSMLQIHLRDLEGYRKTRYSLLQLKPGQRAPWIGYAISNHLLKDYMLAYKVLDEFGKSQQSQEAQYEYSELLLYQNEILREAGHYQQALDHLKQNEKRILDKLALEESRGELCLLLNERDRAEQIFTNLIYRNPEKLSNYEQLERILEPANEAERYEIYQAISERFPRADMPKLKPLSFVTGERFRRLADKTMRRQLSRGVPPLFITFKPCYNDPGKVDIVEDLVKGYLENLSKDPSTFSPDESEEVQPPTVLLWARYFYAQHLDQTKRYEEALAILNLALEHTPTLIELHAAKAKTLKHMGDMEGAVRCMDEAQSLDTADRYINCKCACYMIRNNLMKAAEDCAAKFTRENVSVDEYLREMQCMWYEIECARAHWNADRPGEALKKCHEVDRHFTEIIEDQFDFHQYCMRKMTLRAYSKMLKLEDSIRSHKFYFRAARIAIQVYIELHDEPQLSGDHATTEEESLMSQAELKKLRNKQRRQERKKAAAEEKKKQELEKIAKRKQAAKNQKSAEEVGDVKKEDELQGDKLMSVADPIEQAYRFLIPLELHRADCFETHFFAFQIAERRSRVLVMLRSILRCRKLVSDATVPSMHMCQVRFAKKVSDLGDEVSKTVRDVIERHKSQLLNDIDVTAFNERFLSEHGNSLPHLFTACKAMYHLDNTRKREALELLLNFDKNMKNVEFPVCSSILKAIKAKRDFGAIEGKLVNDFRAKCHDIFPRANIFYKRDVTSIIVNGLPPSSGGEGAPANDSRKTAPPPLPNGMHTDEAHTASAMVEDHCSHDL